MKAREVWAILDSAQITLEKFLEANGGEMDYDTGNFDFKEPSKFTQYRQLLEVGIAISNAQRILEHQIARGGF